jgi:hypothetical protein
MNNGKLWIDMFQWIDLSFVGEAIAFGKRSNFTESIDWIVIFVRQRGNVRTRLMYLAHLEKVCHRERNQRAGSI